MTSLQLLHNSREICRMSWFLIEMDEGQSKGGKENGRIVYGVIHSIDLVDNDSTNMYINRRVRFNWNHAIIEGRVKLASDDRYFIEQQFKTLTKNNEGVILKQRLSKRYLVQFNKGANTIVHAIVHQKEIVWPKEDFQNSTIREVLIRDGKIQRMATVLHVSESDDLIQKELDMLKARCFEGAFEEPYDNNDIEETPWLFVQYSSGPSNVSYSIINICGTVWQEENLYRNVVAYIKEGETVHQAIIIRKSKDRNKLDSELRSMKDYCLKTDFPISGTSCFKVSLPPLDHQALCAKPVTILPVKREKYQIVRH
ncbi:early boundary activity protein 3-like [Musca vetustissima]|uniref:early boundary activity protein 3-like n=1 Tax=Musca vetustissima TaxID=27455 RepID=UPI002AB759F1|nr:early boundary activity protein 3-like [Musca vetustissima]